MSSIGKKATPAALEGYLRVLFPEFEVYKNARRGTPLISPLTGFPMELDFWLPNIKLAFEFQDPHHYTSGWVSTKTHARTQLEDSIKQEAMTQKGQTLIPVPYWWDGTIQSLAATIKSQRPDLLQNYSLSLSPSSSPIPDFPPPLPHTGDYRKISDIGGVMQISFPPFDHFNPKNWWVSEKYDGVRALWHPRQSVFYSRFGHELPFLSRYSTLFPSVFIDSEVWFGRDTYRMCQQILYVIERETEKETERETTIEDEFLRFVSFDSPSLPLSSSLSFESRFESLLNHTSFSHPCIIPTGPQQCKGIEDSQNILQTIFESSGEGIVVIRPTSVYVSGYSPDALKIKKSRDHEALVIGLDDNGDYILLEHATGTYFTGQLSAAFKNNNNIKNNNNNDIKNKNNKIQRGEVVTYAFDRYGPDGSPWKALIIKHHPLRDWSNHPKRTAKPNSRSLFVKREVKPHGHWSIEEGINIKKFLENFSRKYNFDPLVPSNWYNVRIKDICQEKNGISVFSKYKSTHKLILDHYPNIGLDVSRFHRVKGKSHSDTKREWMDTYARHAGFDPLLADNWYAVNPSDLLKSKEGKAIRKHYGSIRAALTNLYPEVLFETFKFSKLPQGYWQEDSRKLFFDNLAKKRGFDPLIAENWYFLDKKTITNEKGGFSILAPWKGSVIRTLKSVYPDIGLNITKFKKVQSKYWHSMENRKKFFDELAKEKGFDPLQAEKWKMFTQADIMAAGGKTLLSMYNNSHISALLDIYPDIGLHHGSFRTKPQGYWNSTNNLRIFCDTYAAKKGFNPLNPDNWYNMNRAEMLADKVAWKLVHRFGSLSSALIHLYPELHLQESSFVLSRPPAVNKV